MFSEETAAEAAHEANRVLQRALGENVSPPWNEAPDWQRASALAGVHQIATNPGTTPEQSHEGWLAMKEREGWVFGPVKNAEEKVHPCMLPYAQLPHGQRAKDDMFGAVVRAALGIGVAVTT